MIVPRVCLGAEGDRVLVLSAIKVLGSILWRSHSMREMSERMIDGRVRGVSDMSVLIRGRVAEVVAKRDRMTDVVMSNDRNPVMIGLERRNHYKSDKFLGFRKRDS